MTVVTWPHGGDWGTPTITMWELMAIWHWGVPRVRPPDVPLGKKPTTWFELTRCA